MAAPISKKLIHKKITLPEGRRIIAISDIHGHLDYLKGLLEKISFREEDILFLVGDFLERGAQSLAVLRAVMELCKRYTVYPLIGNVDAWRLETIRTDGGESDEQLYAFWQRGEKWWGSCFLKELCAEIGFPIASPEDIAKAKPLLREHFRKEFEFLDSLPTVIETGRFIFVHGGLPKSGTADLEGLDAFVVMKNDAFADKGYRYDKYVVVGHWPVTLYGKEGYSQHNPVFFPAQKILAIDGGCGVKDDGQLNALLIPDCRADHFSFASFDGFPQYAAKTAQQGSLAPTYIHWGDNGVELLEKGEDFSKIRHKSSGREILVPAAYLYETDSGLCCEDYSDYRPPIKEGEAVSLVTRVCGSALIKWNGVTGWYDGELEPLEREGETENLNFPPKSSD